jgi:non-canonical purine NTP pyrophosphatase (RdgB/HAM1 family)
MPSEREVLDYFFAPQADCWQLKRYDSIYLAEAARFEFLHALVAAAQRHAELRCLTRVTAVERVEAGDHYSVELTSVTRGSRERVDCRAVVLAGGRFQPLQRLTDQTCFRRHEFGLRLELPWDNAALQRIGACGLLDPKLVLQPAHNVQFRTFCFCRRGVVCESEINGLRTYSGRADVAPTERTNLGLMARTTDATAFAQADVDRFLRAPFQITVGSLDRAALRERLVECSGAAVGAFLWQALEQLLREYPELLCAELTLYGPCLEGVGEYPEVDAHLRVRGAPDLYAIGDASGTFRGLVPSLLSGLYLARELRFRATAPLLLTSNANKVREISAALGAMRSIELRDAPIDDCDANVHAQLKARLALEQHAWSTSGRYLLTEVTSLEIDVLHGFPGVFVRSFFERLGVDAIFRLCGGSAATFISILTLIDTVTRSCESFRGACRGTIVAPSGTNGFDWDCLFQPDGYAVTYADMDHVVKTKISARFLAAQQLRDRLAADQ